MTRFTTLRAMGKSEMRFVIGKPLKKTATETGRTDGPKVSLYRFFCATSDHLDTLKWHSLQQPGC